MGWCITIYVHVYLQEAERLERERQAMAALKEKERLAKLEEEKKAREEAEERRMREEELLKVKSLRLWAATLGHGQV